MKINGSNDEMLRAAAEQFGDKTVDEVMFSKLPHLKHLYNSQLSLVLVIWTPLHN